MFKAMLAGSLPEDIKDFSCVKFPVLVSPKLDGVRAMVQGGKLISRNLKEIPNRYTQQLFGRPEFEGLDGELIVGSPTAEDVFRTTTSAVMAEDGEPDVRYYVFDRFSSAPFSERLIMADYIVCEGKEGLALVHHELVNDVVELHIAEARYLDHGFEGAMLRSPSGPYKQGRSTLREGYLLKLKRFQDGEAVILGFEEQMHNANEKTLVSNGKAKRSHHKAGLVGKGTLGALLVEDLHNCGVQFSIGTGFDDATRKEIWDNRDAYRGKIVKYKCFPKGAKDKPRFPVFLGLRDARDMSAPE